MPGRSWEVVGGGSTGGILVRTGAEVTSPEDLILLIEGLWEVVGGEEKGGIVAREGQDTSSPQISERLSFGALVKQDSRAADPDAHRLLTESSIWTRLAENLMIFECHDGRAPQDLFRGMTDGILATGTDKQSLEAEEMTSMGGAEEVVAQAKRLPWMVDLGQ
mmetsp:Transcript_38610/g.115307  ORF Transcript_38610/g.115307 Transcript_38610/m.115307 type:complete len:163 (+) Transcript_38610:43-531(+)